MVLKCYRPLCSSHLFPLEQTLPDFARWVESGGVAQTHWAPPGGAQQTVGPLGLGAPCRLPCGRCVVGGMPGSSGSDPGGRGDAAAPSKWIAADQEPSLERLGAGGVLQGLQGLQDVETTTAGHHPAAALHLAWPQWGWWSWCSWCSLSPLQGHWRKCQLIRCGWNSYCSHGGNCQLRPEVIAWWCRDREAGAALVPLGAAQLGKACCLPQAFESLCTVASGADQPRHTRKFGLADCRLQYSCTSPTQLDSKWIHSVKAEDGKYTHREAFLPSGRGNSTIEWFGPIGPGRCEVFGSCGWTFVLRCPGSTDGPFRAQHPHSLRSYAGDGAAEPWQDVSPHLDRGFAVGVLGFKVHGIVGRSHCPSFLQEWCTGHRVQSCCVLTFWLLPQRPCCCQACDDPSTGFCLAPIPSAIGRWQRWQRCAFSSAFRAAARPFSRVQQQRSERFAPESHWDLRRLGGLLPRSSRTQWPLQKEGQLCKRCSSEIGNPATWTHGSFASWREDHPTSSAGLSFTLWPWCDPPCLGHSWDHHGDSCRQGVLSVLSSRYVLKPRRYMIFIHIHMDKFTSAAVLVVFELRKNRICIHCILLKCVVNVLHNVWCH